MFKKLEKIATDAIHEKDGKIVSVNWNSLEEIKNKNPTYYDIFLDSVIDELEAQKSIKKLKYNEGIPSSPTPIIIADSNGKEYVFTKQKLSEEYVSCFIAGHGYKESNSVNKTPKTIEKPWAVYRDDVFGPIGFGKIIRDETTVLDISYSEAEVIPNAWDPKYVERFNTLEEAVECFIQKRLPCDSRLDREIPDEEIRNSLAKRLFPSYFEKKS